MHDRKYEFVIAGSGAGGATMAKELAARGKDVLVVEKGEYCSEFGTLEDIVRFYDASKSTKGLRYSEEGVMLLRTFMAGGSTVVSCGNGVRCLERELADLGVTLEEEFVEAEQEMGIAPISENLLSEGSKTIRSAAAELGYRMELMPKFINPAPCGRCGRCWAGCQRGAKWTALSYLEQARQSGADIVCGIPVREVLVANGKARGIVVGEPGTQTEILADKVILCAGALTTPMVLQRSGIKDAGTGLFVDTFVNVYGLTTGLNLMHEPSMALIGRDSYDDEGFILSPFINHLKVCRFAELGVKGLTLPLDKLIGLMVKIQDEPAGCVRPDGSVSKPVTKKDQVRLQKGAAMAKEIMAKAGADDESFMVSKPQGPHPGGTAAIGRIVNSDLESEVDNLFVCDASVLPTSPGLPPILTIVALAKRLAKILA
jgi:choline dehydrogenase-like flavoprotein